MKLSTLIYLKLESKIGKLLCGKLNPLLFRKKSLINLF